MFRTPLFFALCVFAAACGGGGGPVGSDTSTSSSTEPDTVTTPDAVTEPETSEPETSEPEPEVVCNPIANTGCEPGEKCTYDTTDARVCAPAGTLPTGAVCTSDADCALGICMQFEGWVEQYCYSFCKTIGHCPDNAPCLELVDKPYKVCEVDAESEFDNCNILAQDCEPGFGCYATGSDDLPVCVELGTDKGTESVGGTCQVASDCEPGLHCVNDRCYEVCSLNDAEACGIFKQCAGYVAQGVGYCGEQD